MTISLLKNTDAFLLMLRLLICSISRPLQASFVHYVYQFCELQPSDWTAEWQDQVQKVLLQQRRSHRCRRYMQVNVECHPPRKLKPRLAPSSFSRLRTISSRTPSRTPSPSLSVLSLLDQIKLDLKSKKIITPSQPTLLKSSKTDRSKQLVAVLARSIRRMNEAQRHRHRSTVAHKFIGRHGKSEASIIAGELFLQQFLALRKSQKSLFVLSVNGGLLPNFCSIQPKQRKMLHVPVPIMPHNRTRVALYFTLRRIDHQSICFRWKVVGRFKIDLKKVHVLHGIKFRLVSTLGDRYMLLCDSGSIDRAAPKAKMDSERSESMSNEKSQSQSQTSVTGRNNRRESTSRLHQSKTEDSTDASEHSSVSSKLIEKHFRPSFEVHVEWEASNPYDRQLQSKRELADKYVKSLHDHVRLIKYVLVRRLRQSPLIKHGETLDRLLGPARFRRLLGWRLHWMLTEHAFQCGLTAADHGLCIQATIADVRLLRQEFIKGEAKRIDVQPDTDHPTFTLSRNETTKSWFTIGASYFSMEQDHRSVGEYPSSDLDRMAEQRSVGNLSTASSNPLADQARIAERGTKTVQRVTDQTVGQVEQLLDQNQVNTAFWTDTIERAHAWLQHTGDVRPLEQLSHRRLLQWNLIGLGWADQRSQRLQLFDRDSMVGRYLDDFDLASQSVAVLVCKSFGRHPRFVRLNLRPSLSLFSLDNPARQLAIAIVCNRYYQLMMLVITFHQLWIIYPNLKLSQLRSRYGFYIVFFSVDLALQILAKGLWLHSYAYLTNLTNVLQTVFCIVTWFFLFRLQSLDPKLLDKTDFNQDLMQMPGLMQFLIILQCLRLIRGVSRSKVFESLRLFVKVIGTLLPQLFPVAILWMATLLYSTELTHRLFPRLFRQLCVPRWRTQQLEQLAATIEVNDSEYGSSYERMEEAYTRINYNNSLYLFAYRSCGVHRENYLSEYGKDLAFHC